MATYSSRYPGNLQHRFWNSNQKRDERPSYVAPLIL